MARLKRRSEVTDPRNGSSLQLAAPESTVIPLPPENLAPEAAEFWGIYWSSPLATLTTPTDVVLVRRYAVLLSEWSTAMSEFQEQRIVKGSQGQDVLNPRASWITSREAAMTGIEDRLGLSPLSRMKLGVALGEAARSLADVNAAYTKPQGSSTDATSESLSEDVWDIEDD